MPPDPISWLVIEPGHPVVTDDGEQLGTVVEVLGDQTADIFDGLTVTGGLVARSRYVPAELVESIDTEAVRLGISQDRVAELDDLEPPGA
jgi:hypothetical protein